MGPDTKANWSCSAKLKGELFVFGGNRSEARQISKIVDCELKRIGDLPNEFEKVTCGTFLFDGSERVMLCFPKNDAKKCIR